MPGKKTRISTLKSSSIKAGWYVYILRCSNKSLYTGITNHLKERIAAHNAHKGAKYTAAFGPVRLVWSERHRDRSLASKREAEIKKFSRERKLSLIGTRK